MLFNFKPKQRFPSERKVTRVVKSKRWVHRNQLKLGMYVSELDKPWDETRFMFQGFVIDSQTLLEEVQSVSEYVQVDGEKLATTSSASSSRLCGATK